MDTEIKPDLSPEPQAITLDQLKEIHDYYVVTLQILTQKTQHYYEEFDYMIKLVAFYKALLKDTKAKIEALEPTKAAE